MILNNLLIFKCGFFNHVPVLFFTSPTANVSQTHATAESVFEVEHKRARGWFACSFKLVHHLA